MERSASFALEPGTEVAGKYLVGERAQAALSRPAYAGTVKETAQEVVLSVVSAREAARLQSAVGLEHAHLVRVLDLVERAAGDSVLVCEKVAGSTCAEVLAERGSLSPPEAVRSVLRVADALASLHEAGAAHGRLRPGSVIWGAEGRASPLLAYAPPLDQSSPYRSPERGSTGPASTADDTWALAGLLYELLTGKPPPSTGIQSEDELGDLGLEDAALRTALAHGLAPAVSHRASDVSDVKRELARWYVEHGDEGGRRRTSSQAPPPLPSSTPLSSTPLSSTPLSSTPLSSTPLSSTPLQSAPAPPTAPSEVPQPSPSAAALQPNRPRLWLWVAIGALPLGAVASWGVASSLSADEVVVEVPRPASAAPSASASAASIDLSEVPMTGESELATGDPMATCAAGYLPKGAFPGTAPNMAWVCDELDPRTGAKRLRSAVVKGAGGKVTTAMKLMSQLGWYQMAAYSIVHVGCCPEGKPLELPQPSEGCPPVAAPLSAVGAAVVAERDHEASLQRFEKAIACEVKARRAQDFGGRGKPKASQAAAFGKLVEAIRAEH